MIRYFCLLLLMFNLTHGTPVSLKQVIICGPCQCHTLWIAVWVTTPFSQNLAPFVKVRRYLFCFPNMSMPELNAKGVIMQAMDQFRLKSCIDFKSWNDEKYYISVQKCFSYVGRYFSNGQDLSIGTYCDSKAIVEHEFLHALGFFHEQSRYDRDEYVTIEFQNIIKRYENNFEKQSEKYSTTHGVPYDYMSVMHYGPNAFSNGNGSTITTKDPAFQDIIGQRLEMSPSDVKELNLLYKCSE
uniref:Metalloendopeptidase n=1 Tax=Periophthalmus magnuspinnatus TaxID=409849 RepID=A0A3B3ZK03_9GOBI